MKYIITESQYKLLTEELSVGVRRRIPFENLINDLEWGVLEHMSPCEYNEIGDFIADACDGMVDLFADYSIDEYKKNLTPKDRDSLYHFFVDKFGDYLIKYHKQMCV